MIGIWFRIPIIARIRTRVKFLNNSGNIYIYIYINNSGSIYIPNSGSIYITPTERLMEDDVLFHTQVRITNPIFSAPGVALHWCLDVPGC